jgi:hypothetical protein
MWFSRYITPGDSEHTIVLVRREERGRGKGKGERRGKGMR